MTLVHLLSGPSMIDAILGTEPAPTAHRPFGEGSRGKRHGGRQEGKGAGHAARGRGQKPHFPRGRAGRRRGLRARGEGAGQGGPTAGGRRGGREGARGEETGAGAQSCGCHLRNAVPEVWGFPSRLRTGGGRARCLGWVRAGGRYPVPKRFLAPRQLLMPLAVVLVRLPRCCLPVQSACWA